MPGRSTSTRSTWHGATRGDRSHCEWPSRPSIRAWNWNWTPRCVWKLPCSRRPSPRRIAKPACGPSWNPGPARPSSRAVDPRRRRLARTEHAELVALGVGQHDPGDVALADVDAARTKPDQAAGLGLLVIFGGRCQVQVHAVLGLLGVVDRKPVSYTHLTLPTIYSV